MSTLAMTLAKTGILIPAASALVVACAMLAAKPSRDLNAAAAMLPMPGAAVALQASWPPPPAPDGFVPLSLRDCPEGARGPVRHFAPVGKGWG